MIGWKTFSQATLVFTEIIPGFICAFISIIVVSFDQQSAKLDVTGRFEQADQTL